MKRYKLKYSVKAESKEVTEPEQLSIDILEKLDSCDNLLQDFYIELAQTENPQKYSSEIKAKHRSLIRTSANLAKAYKKTLSTADELRSRHKDICRSKKHFILPETPANTVIDITEQQTGCFAKGLNIYKLLLIFYAGSFVGVVVEMLWCLLNYGYIESRAGLVYGPFNALYGIGAVAMTLALYKYRNNSRLILFIGGSVIGGVVEYFCSFAQEMVFGSRSWDYSDRPFNINGRICLLYSFFWGFLGILWIKTLYPLLSKYILKLPDKYGKVFTWLIFAFFLFNAVVTILALFRWSQRIEAVEAASALWEFIDMRFPDERMESIFANMVFN